MSFAWPWLFLLLPLPWVLRMLLAPAQGGTALRVQQIPDESAQVAPPAARLWIAALGWLLLVTAAARPQMPGETAPPAHDSRSLMIAFDVSMSMATTDLRHGETKVERLQAARTLADDFLARRRGDRAGLVVFGSQAYLHTPMTHDLQAVRAALGSVRAGLAGRETALGDAIALSVKYLKTLPAHARVLVLLTDGANTAGTLAPSRAAWVAQREGVRIHAVGVGASSELDESVLRDIAAQTGGTYTRATDSRAMSTFFSGVERAESLEWNAPARPMRELYPWPLTLACLLAATLAWLHRREVAI
jgi:Ca-activated chloride channel homolog